MTVWESRTPPDIHRKRALTAKTGQGSFACYGFRFPGSQTALDGVEAGRSGELAVRVPALVTGQVDLGRARGVFVPAGRSRAGAGPEEGRRKAVGRLLGGHVDVSRRSLPDVASWASQLEALDVGRWEGHPHGTSCGGHMAVPGRGWTNAPTCG